MKSCGTINRSIEPLLTDIRPVCSFFFCFLSIFLNQTRECRRQLMKIMSECQILTRLISQAISQSTSSILAGSVHLCCSSANNLLPPIFLGEVHVLMDGWMAGRMDGRIKKNKQEKEGKIFQGEQKTRQQEVGGHQLPSPHFSSLLSATFFFFISTSLLPRPSHDQDCTLCGPLPPLLACVRERVACVSVCGRARNSKTGALTLVKGLGRCWLCWV